MVEENPSGFMQKQGESRAVGRRGQPVKLVGPCDSAGLKSAFTALALLSRSCEMDQSWCKPEESVAECVLAACEPQTCWIESREINGMSEHRA